MCLWTNLHAHAFANVLASLRTVNDYYEPKLSGNESQKLLTLLFKNYHNVQTLWC